MSPRFATALLALLFAVTAVAVGGVAAQEQTPTNATLVTEETVIEIQLGEDGDAEWTVTEHFAITDETELEAFEDVGDDFEAGAESPLGLETFRRALEDVSSETDRSMAIRNEERNASWENASRANGTAINGTYNLSFTWTNFAREEEDTYVVDDVFVTDGETWFGGITADERLIIALPPGHGASDAPKAVEQRELRWEGPQSFDPGYLRIVYSGSFLGPTQDGVSPAWIALLVAVVASFGAAALLVRRREGDPLAAVAGVLSRDGPDEEPADDGTPADDAGADEDEDLALLSDEERVERLLEDNGGRMKQATIVKETGWSNAKVSQLLSSMEDEERIAKLRIGRENLISFPDEDVGEFES